MESNKKEVKKEAIEEKLVENFNKSFETQINEVTVSLNVKLEDISKKIFEISQLYL